MSAPPRRATPQLTWIAEAAAGDAALEAELLARWEAGEPLQYVLGRWGFRGLDLAVDSRALIPRPETELLVEVALSLARNPRAVVDLGTGSGAIALAIATARPRAQVWAVDASADALSLARANDARARVTFLEGEWYDPLPSELAGGVDLIVSNPPYVSDAEFEALEPAVRDWEPKRALVSGPTGLECLEAVIEAAPGWLAPGGVLALECAPHQIETVISLCESASLAGTIAHNDLAGRLRVVTASRPI